MDFAQRLRELMEDKGITAYRLAKKLNVHQTTVKNWLEGNSRPRAGYMEELADYFEVSIDYLMGYSDDTQYMKQLHFDIGAPKAKVQLSSLNTEKVSNEDHASLLEIMLKYAPNDVLSCLSHLCRNERIEQDLTERYIAQTAQIPLESYLLFESSGKGLLPIQIIAILNALNLNMFSTMGTLRGVVLAFLQDQNMDPHDFLNEIDDNELLREATMLLYSMDSDTLKFALEEMKRLFPEIENRDTNTEQKVQKAYLEALKNRPRQKPEADS